MLRLRSRLKPEIPITSMPPVDSAREDRVREGEQHGRVGEDAEDVRQLGAVRRSWLIT